MVCCSAWSSLTSDRLEYAGCLCIEVEARYHTAGAGLEGIAHQGALKGQRERKGRATWGGKATRGT